MAWCERANRDSPLHAGKRRKMPVATRRTPDHSVSSVFAQSDVASGLQERSCIQWLAIINICDVADCVAVCGGAAGIRCRIPSASGWQRQTQFAEGSAYAEKPSVSSEDFACRCHPESKEDHPLCLVLCAPYACEHGCHRIPATPVQGGEADGLRNILHFTGRFGSPCIGG
jgi:hypothetical protein